MGFPAALTFDPPGGRFIGEEIGCATGAQTAPGADMDASLCRQQLELGEGRGPTLGGTQADAANELWGALRTLLGASRADGCTVLAIAPSHPNRYDRGAAPEASRTRALDRTITTRFPVANIPRAAQTLEWLSDDTANAKTETGATWSVL